VTQEAPIQKRYELQESEEMKVVAMNRVFLILLFVGLILTPCSAVAQDSLTSGLELASMDTSSQGNISMARTKQNQIATVIHITPQDLFVKIPDKGKIRMISVAYCPSLEFKDWRCAHTGTMKQIFAKGLRQMNIEKDADDFELLQVVRVFDSDDSRVSSLWFSYIEKKAISLR
jgi:hypothetical protein